MLNYSRSYAKRILGCYYAYLALKTTMNIKCKSFLKRHMHGKNNRTCWICHVPNLISVIILELKQFPYSKERHDMHFPVNISRVRRNTTKLSWP